MDIFDVSLSDGAAKAALRDVIQRVAEMPGVAKAGLSREYAYMDAAGIVSNVLVNLCRKHVEKRTLESLT
jgi:hypothetical protein